MADSKTRQLSQEELQEDLDSFAGLESLGDYDPSNADYATANGKTLKADMQASETKEVQDYAVYQASRDAKVAKQWAFHDFVRNAKIQVKAQYGESSDELQTVGLKKKSEYKSPKRKTPQT